MAEQCCKNVYRTGGPWGGSSCSVPAKVNVDGKWYCHIHDPAKVAKRRALENKRSQERWRKEQAERKASSFLKIIVEGYSYDPGDSDLDDEQPIHVKMTLGDYRRARQLFDVVSA